MMKERAMRGFALLLAAVLLAAWFFLPWKQESTVTSNNGRDKQELLPGESLSWSWTPENGDADQLRIRLSGLKKVQGLTLIAELADSSGKTAASVRQAVAEMGDADTLNLEGTFSRGTVYTLTVTAEGEGSIKLRGEETEDGFSPEMSWSGSTTVRNAVLIYFAAGLALVALLPLPNGRKRARGRKSGGIAALLPWGTFFLIAGVGLLIVYLKPIDVFEGVWRLWDEETHWNEVRFLILGTSDPLSYQLQRITTWTPGYLPLMLGAGIARFFTADETILYRAATACSVLVYALLAAIAVRRAPRYKASFLAASAFPGCLFLSTGATYDTVVIGCILLGTAMVLEILDQKERMTAAQGITLFSVLAFGTAAKPAYSVALLLPLMIPAGKLGSRGRAWLLRLLALMLMAWCFAAVAMPGAYDNVREGDFRFTDADVPAQLAWLNGHPAEWILVPLCHLYQQAHFLLIEGIAHWAFLGTNLTLDYLFCGLLLAASLIVCGELQGTGKLLKPGRRILLGGTAFLAEIILILTQYVVSSRPGGSVQGVQARYFLPVWILLALALMMPEKVRNLLRKAGPWLAAALWMGCLGVDLWYALYWLQSTGCI